MCVYMCVYLCVCVVGMRCGMKEQRWKVGISGWMSGESKADALIEATCTDLRDLADKPHLQFFQGADERFP